MAPNAAHELPELRIHLVSMTSMSCRQPSYMNRTRPRCGEVRSSVFGLIPDAVLNTPIWPPVFCSTISVKNIIHLNHVSHHYCSIYSRQYGLLCNAWLLLLPADLLPGLQSSTCPRSSRWKERPTQSHSPKHLHLLDREESLPVSEVPDLCHIVAVET